MNTYVALLLAYSAALTALGLWVARRVKVPADFFVAGRQLSWPLIGATMLASNIGAGATVGATGLAYQQGVSAWFWNGSAGVGSLVLAFVIGPRMWRLAADRGYLTVGDFLEDRYDRNVRVVVASLTWLGTLFILAGQLLAGAAVFTVVAGMPKWAGVLVGGIVMTGYFGAGGLLSSVWVNAVQLVVTFVGFALAIPLLMTAAGGFEGLANTPGVATTYFDPLYSAGAMSGFTLLLLSAPNFMVSPGLVQKTYAARSARDVRLGVGANAVALMVFACIPVVLGMTARAAFPGIENPNTVLPTVLLYGLPMGIGALALAAVFSAEVSTCDVILFMLATSLSQDLYKRFINPGASPDRVLLVARLAALGGGAAGVLLAIFLLDSVIGALSIFYSLIGATLLVPVMGGLFVKRAGSAEALTSIACGMIVLLAVRFGTPATGWWNPNLWGLTASAIGYGGMLMTRRT